MRFTIYNKISHLNFEMFTFSFEVNFAECSLYLEDYELFEQSGRLGQYKVVKEYHLAKHKVCNMFEQDVVINESVEKKALDMIMGKITFKRLNDRKRKGKGRG